MPRIQLVIAYYDENTETLSKPLDWGASFELIPVEQKTMLLLDLAQAVKDKFADVVQEGLRPKT